MIVGDVFLVSQINDASNTHVSTKFIQVLGGAFPTFSEIDAQGCARRICKKNRSRSRWYFRHNHSSRDSDIAKLEIFVCLKVHRPDWFLIIILLQMKQT